MNDEPRRSLSAPAPAGRVRSHGARSESQIRAKARNAKRRFLRQQGLRAGDLDGVAHAYLAGWSRATAKCELYDDYDGLHGSREYIACANSARLFMTRLERRMRELGLDRAQPPPGKALAAYLAAKGNGKDGA